MPTTVTAQSQHLLNYPNRGTTTARQLLHTIGGSPTGATLSIAAHPQIATAIISAVRRGVPVTTAARAAGIAANTIVDWSAIADGAPNWRDGTPVTAASRSVICDFWQEVTRAAAEWETETVQGIANASRAVNPKTGIPEWRAGAWLLNNLPGTRQRYHEHREVSVEHTVHDATIAQLASLTDDELRASLALPAPDAKEIEPG